MGTYTIANDELYHHGVLGMKWGVRRYQSYAENPKLSDRKKAKMDYKARKAEIDEKFNKAGSEWDKAIRNKNSTREQANNFNKAFETWQKETKANKAQYKADKIQAKYEKKASRSEASDAKITAAREKKLNEIIDRYGKDSAHYLDFSKGSEYVKAGQTKYNDIIRDYGKMRAAAAKDPSIKNTPEYKAAKTAYRGQEILKAFMYNGIDEGVKLDYTVKAARSDQSIDWDKNSALMKVEKERYKKSKKGKNNNSPNARVKKSIYK